MHKDKIHNLIMKHINKNNLLILIILFFFSGELCAQKTNDDNLIYWSATRKLTTNNFGIKTKNQEKGTTLAQFCVDYQVKGFDFLTKNFNKKVHNYMIKSASQIDTTANVQQSLQYQQTLFDLCEIYARKLRKALRENRKKLISGLEIAKELDNQIMTDFANRKSEYTLDTSSATDQIKQQKWESQIAKELEELNEFAYEK